MDLFQVVKIKRLRDFRSIMDTIGAKGSVGCEICKPAVASILSSLYNDHVMKPEHHGSQDTNDRWVSGAVFVAVQRAVWSAEAVVRFLANIQRNGTFSVVPRIPGGEIHPDKLVAIGKIAKEYGLYTKITGGTSHHLVDRHNSTTKRDEPSC